jgi:hypothetical protein
MFVSSARLAPALLETLFNDTGERLVDVFLARDDQMGTYEEEVVEVSFFLNEIESTVIYTIEHTRSDRVRLTLGLVEQVRFVL